METDTPEKIALEMKKDLKHLRRSDIARIKRDIEIIINKVMMKNSTEKTIGPEN
jgi:hypothetical protein